MDISARIENANQVLRVISSHGRRFFWSQTHNRVSHFIRTTTAVYYVDHWTGSIIDTATDKDWHGFTNGSTLRRLVEDLAQYIRTGEPISSEHFGPWSYCRGDLWGYGQEEMEKVRRDLSPNPAIEKAVHLFANETSIDLTQMFTVRVVDEYGVHHLAHVSGVDAEDAGATAAENISEMSPRSRSIHPEGFNSHQDYLEAVERASREAFHGTRMIEVWPGTHQRLPETEPVYARDFMEAENRMVI